MRRFLTLLLVVASSVALSPIASSNGKEPGSPKRLKRSTSRPLHDELSPIIVCPNLCAPCPACPDLACAPWPSCICEDAEESKRERVEIRYVESSLYPSGFWSVPLTLGWLPGSDDKIEWVDGLARQKPIDPSLAVSHDSRFFVGAGLAYQWPSRWQLGVQALYFEALDSEVAWIEKPTLPSYPRVRHSAPAISTDESRWGIAITLSIPLSRGGSE